MSNISRLAVIEVVLLLNQESIYSLFSHYSGGSRTKWQTGPKKFEKISIDHQPAICFYMGVDKMYNVFHTCRNCPLVEI